MKSSCLCYKKVMWASGNDSGCDREKDFQCISRPFSLSVAAAFRYYLWQEWTGLMEGERSSSIASPPPNLRDGKELLRVHLPSGLRCPISAGATAGAAQQAVAEAGTQEEQCAGRKPELVGRCWDILGLEEALERASLVNKHN